MRVNSLLSYTEGAAYRSTANRQPTNASGPSASKVQRTNYKGRSANYDRIFTFIDLMTPGQCFNIFSQSARKSELLLKYGKELSSVGDIFGVVEPDDVVKGSQNVLNLTTAKPLIPLKFRYGIIPSVPLVQPPMGHQRYFILKNQTIGISHKTRTSARVAIFGRLHGRSASTDRRVCKCRALDHPVQPGPLRF